MRGNREISGSAIGPIGSRGPRREGGADKSAECRGTVSMLFRAPIHCRRHGSCTSGEVERLDKGLLIRGSTRPFRTPSQLRKALNCLTPYRTLPIDFDH